MARHLRNLRLDDALDLPGCPLCRLVVQRVESTMESIDYEFVNDPGWREQAEDAWGFCNVHAHQWLAVAHPLGTALIYQGVLRRIDDQLRRVQIDQDGLSSRLRNAIARSSDGRLDARGTCPFCIVRSEETATSLQQLLTGLGDGTLASRYADSDGLCITHLDAALALGPPGAVLDILRAHAAETHRRLQEHLQEIVRKHDYRFRNEPIGEERGSVERAVEHVAGSAGVGDRRPAGVTSRSG